MAIKKMNPEQWRKYVQYHLDERKERAAYFLDSFFRLISVSLVVGLIASALVIGGWGFREYSRMMLQVILTAAFATTFFGALFRRFERKKGK